MLPGGTDLLYRRALAAGHRNMSRVEVWDGSGQQLAVLEPDTGQPEGGLVFLDGLVTATLASRVTRQLMLSVPGHLYNSDLFDVRAGNELRVYQGLMFGDSSYPYSWQVFRGRIRQPSKSSTSGACRVLCADRAADVVDHAFVNPQNSQTVNTVLLEFMRLIQDAVPDATFGVSGAFSAPVQPLTWELDRAAALDEMARASAGIWYALADGSFVMRPNPYATPALPVLTLTDAAGGTVNHWECSKSRDQIFNVVTVSGERLNGDRPVYATASDTDPTSPTFVDGPFGVRSRLERLQTPFTEGGAFGAASAILSASIAPVEAWQLSVVPDAALELGDVLRLDLDDRSVVQVVSSFQLPLGVSSDMSISTRSLVVGSLEVTL